jgi:hypothetical protein
MTDTWKGFVSPITGLVNVFVYGPPGEWGPYLRVDAIANALKFSARSKSKPANSEIPHEEPGNSGEIQLDLHEVQLLVTNLQGWIREQQAAQTQGPQQ